MVEKDKIHEEDMSQKVACGDDDNEDPFSHDIYDDALVIADFLTTFHNNYDTGDYNSLASLYDGRPIEKRIISPKDVISAIEYRNDIERYYHLSNLIQIISMQISDDNVRKSLSRLIKDEEERRWIRQQQRLTKGRFSTDESTLHLIEAYELQTSFLFANKMLLHKPSPTCIEKGNVSSCSTFLNIPSGDYLSWLLPTFDAELEDLINKDRVNDNSKGVPRIDHVLLQYGGGDRTNSSKESNSSKEKAVNKIEDFKGSLGILHNSLTWKELLRLSTMISSLQSTNEIKKASTSLLTQSNFQSPGDGFDESNPELLKPKKGDQYSTKQHFNPADLIALWVRAQRNTSAFYQLIDLFKVEFVEKCDVENSDEMNFRDNNPDVYSNKERQKDNLSPLMNKKAVAKYVGNHRKMKHIEKESALVEKLVNWAITNQILYTHEYMRSELPKEEKQKNGRTKKRCIMASNGNKCKKRRYNYRYFGESVENDIILRKALQVFVLRWFARRNRDILHIIFSSNPNNKAIHDCGLEVVDIVKKVKEYLKENCDGSTDRTLARIDRRVFTLDKYETNEDFDNSVLSLLLGLQSAIPKNSPLQNDVDRAKHDYMLLSQKFLHNEAEILLHHFDSGEMYDANVMSELLQSYPAPWLGKCHICSDDKSNESTQKCWNCGLVSHSKCDPHCFEPKKFHDCRILSSLYWFPSLAKDFPEVPDFSTDEKSMGWIEEVIIITRRSEGENWGLHMYHTEHCSAALKETQDWLESGSDLSPLLRKTRDPPLRLPFGGMVVYDLDDNRAASLCGIRRGDTIIAAMVSPATTIEDSNSFQSFDSMNEHERMNVFKNSKLSIKIKVCRSSIDIIEKSYEYRNAEINIINKLITDHDQCTGNRWYCVKCRSDYRPVTDINNTDVTREAKLCQALIFRLGMEWCSLPFHDEEIPITRTLQKDNNNVVECIEIPDLEQDLPPNDLQFVSLRRLHEMMVYIIANARGEPVSNHISPFFAPPWAELGVRGLKLSWTAGLESQPFMLLCKGIGLIVNSIHDQDKYKPQRCELRKRFIKLFITMCLDLGDIAKPCLLNHSIATHDSVGPWVSRGCCICSVRRTIQKEASWVCNATECLELYQQRLYTADGTNEEIKIEKSHISSKDKFQASIDQYQYDYYASFVGTTILILPDDPLMRSFEQTSQLPIQKSNGPLTLIVISFVPSEFASDENISIVREVTTSMSTVPERNVGGFFYLIPVVSTQQLTFVLENCKMRQYHPSNDSWFKLKVLHLLGIIVFTPNDLKRRIETSNHLFNAIEAEILSLTHNSTKVTTRRRDDEETQEEVESKYSQCQTLGDGDTLFNRLQLTQSYLHFEELNNFFEALDDTSNDLSSLKKYLFSTVFEEERTTLNQIECTSACEILILMNQLLFEDLSLFSHLYLPSTKKCFDGFLPINDTQKTHASRNFYDKLSTFYPICHQKGFIHGLVQFQHSDAVKSGLCTLCYSDLLYWENRYNQHGFWNEGNCKTMKEADLIVSSQVLVNPRILKVIEPPKSIDLVLHREALYYNDTANDSQQYQAVYNGVGWGFELVRWLGDKCRLRVGRIVPNSPAAKAGFRTHDVILSINGHSVKSIQSFKNLSEHILGMATTSNNPVQQHEPKYASAATLYGLDQAVVGPVFVSVRRQIYDNCTSEIEKRNDADNFQQYQQQQQIQKHYPQYQDKQRFLKQVHQHQTVDQQLTSTQLQNHSSIEGVSITSNRQRTKRQHFDASHLYALSINRSSLSLAETCVLVEALERKQPQLGFRLLCPRYNRQFLQKEYSNVIYPYIKQYGRLSNIPKLHDSLWKLLLIADWERSLKETGEVCYREDVYEYKEPVEVLPIDRFFETVFRNWKYRVPMERNLMKKLKEDINSVTSHYRGYNQVYHPGQQLEHRDHVPRIRGGGLEEENVPDERYSLAQIEKSKWNNLAVFGKCNIDKSSDIFLGRVVDEGGDKAIVSIIYIVSKGFVEKNLHPFELDPSGLFLVPGCNYKSSDESIVENFTNSSSSPRKDIGKQISPLISNKPIPYGNPRAKKINNCLDSSTQTQDHLFGIDTQGGSSLLGHLPDGKLVYWFRCDPGALYLYRDNKIDCESSSVLQKRFLINVKNFSKGVIPTRKGYNISPCDYSMNCCVWGCSQAIDGNENERVILGFQSRDELEAHNKKCHSYSKVSYCWERLDEGKAIQDLSLNLVSSICAKSFLMTNLRNEVTDNKIVFEENLNFDIRRVHEFLCRKEHANIRNHIRNINVLDGLKVWFKISLLFAIESTGCFRRDHSFGTYTSSINKESTSSLNGESDFIDLVCSTIIDEAKTGNGDNHMEANTSTEKCNIFFNLPIPEYSGRCCLYQLRDKQLLRTSSPLTCSQFHRTACTSALDFTVITKTKLLDAVQSLTPVKGKINQLKVLLLKAASNVPQNLYASQQKNKHILWNDALLDVWIRFVGFCSCARMAAHAYVVLMNSVNKEKMPFWWNSSKCGWADSFALLSKPSLSSVALHVYVFDIAIASSLDIRQKNAVDASTAYSDDLIRKSKGDVSSHHEHDKVAVQKDSSPDTSIAKYHATKLSMDDIISIEDGDHSQLNRAAFSLNLKMQQVLRWTDEDAVPRYQGSYEEICLRCGTKSGDLALCQLCANVAHLDCLGYVGDADNLEFVCDDCINHWYCKNENKAIDQMKKMKKVIQWVGEENAPRYRGESADECIKCQGGGQVLLCELCPTVIHQECIGFQGGLNDFDYVCDSCVDKWYWKKKDCEAIKSYIMIEDVQTCINRNPLIIKLQEEKKLLHQSTNETFEMLSDDNVVCDNENDTWSSMSDLDNQSALDIYLASEAKFQSNHGTMCRFLLSMSSYNRIRQIIAWCDEKKIPRNKKAHHNYCEKCGNGEGYSIFYKCSFCANVFHQECIGLSPNADQAEYICDDCIIDFLKALALW